MGIVEVSIPTAAPAMNLSSCVSMYTVLLRSSISPSNHKHGHVDGRSLQNTADQGHDRACSDSPLTTKVVGDDHIDDRTQNSSTLEGRDDATSDCAVGIVEVLNELRERDDTSDDTRIITKQEASDSEEGTRQDDCCFSHGCWQG